jgi:teichuronic acid biosynthesis glycosyltransferase TuaC
MRKIALITPMLPVPHDSTRGRYIYETARSLSRIAEVKVFFQQIRYPRLPWAAPRSFLHADVGPDYRIEGLDVEAFSYPGLPVVSRAFNGMVAAQVLTPKVRAFNPDLVLAYWVYPDGDTARRVARRLGKPCVVGALGSDIHVRSGFTHWLTGRVVQGVDALLTVSEAMRRSAIKEFGAQPERVHTIINGFNADVFYPRPQAPLRATLGLGTHDKVIIYVGRFVEAKGLRELVTAFTAMSQTRADLRLALVGDGVMKTELLALLDAAGIRNKVHLPGGLEPMQVADWIAASDVLTLPSWSEGYPNVVVEAVACGRPVVATDVGGTNEIIHKHNGILVPPRNPQALQAGLEQALSADWDHDKIAAAIKRTWDDVAVQTLQVCERVMGSR